MEPQTRIEGPAAMDPARVKLIKIGIAVIAVIALAVLAYFIYDAIRSEKAMDRWDDFSRIQNRFEMGDLARTGRTDSRQDPLFEDPTGEYGTQRKNYIAELERFLPTVADDDDTLAAQAHWLIAKLSATQVLSMKDETDPAKRRVWWDKASEHMEILRSRYSGFQTNWTTFAPTGHASLTRAFLSTIQANLDWESKHLPAARTPTTDPVVLIRTERGDLRVHLFREEAPRLTELFLQRALRGDYDGTAFFAKTDETSGDMPDYVTLRAGHPATREAKPFDHEGHAAFEEEEDVEQLLGESSRWLVPAERGVLLTWHDPATEYDGPQQFVIAQDRSPRLDYLFTPLGRLADEASQETADRIFAGEAWREDTTGTRPVEVGDFLQVPVRIVKVLVYEKGQLVEPDNGGPHKASADAGEQTLEGLAKDAYLKAPPSRPAPPIDEGAGEEEGASAPEPPTPPMPPEQPDEPEAPDESSGGSPDGE